jgi:hypothetical protein
MPFRSGTIYSKIQRMLESSHHYLNLEVAKSQIMTIKVGANKKTNRGVITSLTM